MKQSTEELKKILADAPKGATHFDGKTYFRFKMFEHGQAYLVFKNGLWQRGLPAYPVYSCRSLSDIKEIVELREAMKPRAQADIAQPVGSDDYSLGA